MQFKRSAVTRPDGRWCVNSIRATGTTSAHAFEPHNTTDVVGHIGSLLQFCTHETTGGVAFITQENGLLTSGLGSTR